MLTGRSSAECCVSCRVSLEDVPRVSGFLYGLIRVLVQCGIVWCSALRGTLGDSFGRNLARRLLRVILLWICFGGKCGLLSVVACTTISLASCSSCWILPHTLECMQVGAVDKAVQFTCLVDGLGYGRPCVSTCIACVAFGLTDHRSTEGDRRFCVEKRGIGVL